MRFKWLTAIAIIAMAIASCNEDTEGLGSSLTNETDKLEISTGIFGALTRSVLADSVYAKNYSCYLGQVKDPETGSYLRNDMMTQFNMLEDFSLPGKERIPGGDQNKPTADSCEIRLYLNRSKCYGDSLTPIKFKMYEMAEPMSDSKNYYSNYDPMKEGLVRKDGLVVSKTFTLANLMYSDSIRKLTSFTDQINIILKDPYTDKNGNVYTNYGSYILSNYYDHPEYFKNSYSFVHGLCPGFYFEVTDGLGAMAQFSLMEMFVYYHYKDSEDTKEVIRCAATQEVIKVNKVTNDNKSLLKLVEDNSCTYLKSPAGIFTEVTLPVDEIISAHSSDSLLSASITFPRLNGTGTKPDYTINAPDTLLLIQKDSLYSFFEKERMSDNKYSFITSLSKNSYTFDNIGNLVTLMNNIKKVGLQSDPDWISKHPNWNKALLVPISVGRIQSSSGYTTTYTTVTMSNQMALQSTRMIKGTEEEPIKLKVIYAKFKGK